MAKRLKEIIASNPKYFMGMQNMAKRLMGPQIETLLKNNKVDVSWSNSDILHHANIKGILPKLFTALNSKGVILVGPAHLKPIDKLVSNVI